MLSLDRLPNAEADTLQTWLAPIAAAVGAELLASDDADAFKTAADELGLDQQVCKAHVVRNTDALVESLTPAVGQDAAGSLAALGVATAQAAADAKRLGELVHSRQPEQAAELADLAARYASARSPRPGQPLSLAYRLRLLFLDRWNLWGRLTRYRTWHGPEGETLDSTNNACERSTGTPLAGMADGSRSDTAVCAAISAHNRRSMSAAYWPGAAITWAAAGPTWGSWSPEAELFMGRCLTGRHHTAGLPNFERSTASMNVETRRTSETCSHVAGQLTRPTQARDVRPAVVTQPNPPQSAKSAYAFDLISQSIRRRRCIILIYYPLREGNPKYP